MSCFNGLKLTKLGEILLANINGNLNETLTFTSGAVGAGAINDDNEINSLTALKDKWKDLDILSIEKDDDDETIVKLELQFSNVDLQEAKLFREIGIYAKGNNGEPVLFAYSNAGENYDYVPLPKDNPQTFTIQINLKITSNSKIDAIINMAGFVTIGKMVEFLKNKLTQIPTVIELQSRKNLKVGDIVEILGYYTAGDGAGHKRIIKTEDDGSGVQLSNKLWANIVHNGEVNVSWFGAKGDGIADDSFILKNEKIKIFNIDKTIFIKSNVSTKGILKNGKIVLENSLKLSGDLKIENCKIETKVSQLFINIIDNNFKFELLNNDIISTLDNSYINLSKIDTLKMYDNKLTKVCIQVANLNNCYIINNLFDLQLKNINIEPIHISIETEGYIVGNKIYRSVTDSIDLYSAGKNTFIENNLISKSELYPSKRGGAFIEAKSILRDLGNGNPGSNEVGFLRNVSIKNNTISNCKTMETGDFSGIYQALIIDTADESIIKNPINNPYNIQIVGNTIDNITLFNGSTMSIFSISGKNISVSNNQVTNIKSTTESDIKSSFVHCSRVVNCTIDCNQVNTENIHGISFKNDNGDIFIQNNYFSTTNKFIILPKGNVENFEFKNNFTKSEFPFFYNNQFTVKKMIISDNVISNIEFECNSANADIFIFGNVSNAIWAKGNSNWYIKNNVFHTSGNYALRSNTTGKMRILNNDFISNISAILFNTEPQECYITGNVYDKKNLYSVLNFSETGKIKSLYNVTSDSTAQAQLTQLNTLHMGEKMKQEGVYNDFIAYMDEKTTYDKQQEKLEKDRQLAYQKSLKENPELTYEEFISLQPMTLNLTSEPEPSKALKQFMEKYL